jgi:hypothetical protein
LPICFPQGEREREGERGREREFKKFGKHWVRLLS